ncbi:MAG: O-antigen ligase family protein [Clostridia bacterium]|nr:O-antigen ligase family protein [Clostridia bacterium]
MRFEKFLNDKTYEKMRLAYMFLFLFAVFTRVFMPIALLETQAINTAVFSFVAIFGAGTILVDLFTSKVLFTAQNKVWLILFLVIVFLSSALNIKYGILGNIRNLVWLTISFFVLYPADINKSAQMLIKDLRLLSNTLIALWFWGILYSLYMFLAQVGYYVYIPPDAFSRQGFIENRLFGIFEDPNYAAMISIIAIMFSFWNLKKFCQEKKSFKIFYCINIILQIFYIALSGSRTAHLVLCGGAFVFSFFYLRQKHFKWRKNAALKEIIYLGLSALLSVSLFFAINLTAKGLSYAPIVFSNLHSQVKNSDETKRLKPVELNREDLKDNSDISSCRVKIWSSALELFLSKPIFGTSPRNMRTYAKLEFPDNFIGKRGYAVHNIYLDVLTSTGILGAVALLIFFIKYLIFVLKYLFAQDIEKKRHYLDVVFCVTIVVMIAASAMSLSEIFFVNTISVLFFWLLLGQSVYFIRKDKIPNLEK